jgi:hypothetical protein
MAERISNNLNTISIRLNHSNYNQWKTAAETFLKQKPLYHHVQYASYDAYRTATYSTSAINEKRYFIARQIIYAKDITLFYTENHQDDEIDELQKSEAYKNTFTSYESSYSKAQEKWSNEETQMEGFFSSCIELNIWQDARCLKSAFLVWEHLKRATGQQTTSSWLSSLNSFFSLSMKQNETLSNFAGRVIQSNNTVNDVGDEKVKFQPLHVIAKIISSIPNTSTYSLLLQSIHQVEKAKLTIEYLQNVFIEEDVRIANALKFSNQEKKKETANQFTPKKSQVPKSEEKEKDKKPRKCQVATCKNLVAADKPSYILKCPTCHTAFMKEKKEAEEKKKDSGDKQKASNVIVLSTTNSRDSESIDRFAKYLDSGSTAHVVNDELPMTNLRICKKLIAGPTGETTSSTFKGSHQMQVEGQSIEFSDVLVVPSLERNLLSVSKITEADENISVIFNKKSFEVFLGEVSLTGRTLFQGHIDETGLYKVSESLDDSATRESAEVERAVVAKVETITYPEKKKVIFSPDSLPLDSVKTDRLNFGGTLGGTLGGDAGGQMPPLPHELPLSAQNTPRSRGIFQSIFSILNFDTAQHSNDPMPNFLNAITKASKQPAKTLQQWHLDLGHLGKKKIQQLADLNLIKIKESSDIFECVSCDAAKMKRKAFAKAMPPKADNVGEVIYSDVCGKISPPTMFGEKYIVTFIDELSGYISVFLLKRKSEVFSHFKDVRARLNNQNATTSVKMFVSDGGGEYIGEEFQEYLNKKGITHVKTPPNTPQRNGKSERLNKILFDLARAMLKHRKMPLRFWGEAVLYAAYIINRTPKIDNDKSRHEMLLGRKPSLSQTLEFGSPVMLHNHDPYIKKLEDRSFEGIFLGFFEDDHTYKILKISTNELISTRTIHSYPQQVLEFDENDWEEKFFVDDDDSWQSGLTNQAQYRLYDQYQMINNNNINNNNINNQNFLKDNFLNDQTNNNDNFLNNNDHNPVDKIQYELSQQDEEEIDDEPPPCHIKIPFHEQVLEIPQPEIQVVEPSHKHATRSKGPIQQQVLSVIEVEQILALANLETPNTFKQAMKSPQVAEWKKSIQAEHQSLIDHGTFEIVDRPINKKPITSRHVFKIKTDDKGAIAKFKTRLVARGFNQTYGEDYFEVFSPTLRMESVRFLIATAVMKQMKVHHLDVETAFLNGTLAEDIFMEIPDGFDQFDKSKQCFKLKKSIYGLKQASRVWNELFTAELINLGFKRSDGDPCIFVLTNQQQLIALIGVFVDDCFIVGGDKDIERIKSQLMNIFKMHDLGPLTFALGIKFNQQKDFSIKMSQSLYVEKMLEKFSMQDCRTTTTPLPIKESSQTNPKPYEDINRYQQLVGSLIYLSNSTRPDIAYAVSFLARSMHAPTESDFSNGKRVLRYLKGTKNLALNFNNNQQSLFVYSDSSYAEEKDRKSVGGYVSMMSGAAITWKSTKQSIIAQSSMEAEYIALAEAAKETQWLRKLQQEIFSNSSSTPTTIFEDNQSTIKLSNNPLHSNRSKHIDVRYHKVQELVANKTINIQYKPTTEMVADIMTKSLQTTLHDRFVLGMGLVVDADLYQYFNYL